VCRYSRKTASDAGAIRETVRDESGAVVTGAKVLLREESKGLIRESESDSSGSFLFTSVIAGLQRCACRFGDR
jgi:hypothetical protein